MVGTCRSRRVVTLAGIALVAVLVVVTRPVHAWLLWSFAAAETVIRDHVLLGMAVFVLLAALSAMLAFVSSAVLVPVAIYVWGPAVCFLLLWTGWFLGGLAGYAVGRYLGRPLVERLIRPGVLGRYEHWARSGKSLLPILIAQLALPSDFASYVFGLVRCRFTIFISALALAEIPYALGSVYFGRSFLQGQITPLVLTGAAAVLVTGWAVHLQDDHSRTANPEDLTELSVKA